MVRKYSKDTSDNLQILESVDEIPTRRGARIPAPFCISLVIGSLADTVKRELNGQIEFYNITYNSRTIMQNYEMTLF
jgi:hypothetical protein